MCKLAAIVLTIATGAGVLATPEDDFKIDRAQVFEFTRKPTVTRSGDEVTIRFASKDYCDVTVAVERENGAIARHIVSGVLGPNAPEPLQKDSLEQVLTWDSKDDRGVYIDDLSDYRVRVSLGVRARFEKTLHWHPKRRLGLRKMPRPVVQPEGVYVYEGAGCETIRLFDHDSRYIRTVHPFPSDKVEQVKGLPWNTFPDGHKAPRARGYWRSTYLMGGEGDTRSKWGSTANAFDVRNGRVAMVSDWGLCRLNTDGACGPHPVYGPATKIPYEPQSIALSPDGKWLYLTGCYKAINRHQMSTHLARVKWQHGVYRMEYGGDKPAQLWLGQPHKAGKGSAQPQIAGQVARPTGEAIANPNVGRAISPASRQNTVLFDHPSDVCVDDKGRIYIADNHNDRVQIFSPDGKLLKSLPVNGPAILQIHHKTGELYVFSWTMALAYGYTAPPHKVQPVLRVFEPFRSAEPKQSIPLPLEGYDGHTRGFMGSPHYDECPYRAALDSHTDPPTVWLGTGWYRKWNPEKNRGYTLSRYRVDERKLVRIEKWNDGVVKAVKTWEPNRLMRKRLYVDPPNGTLYVAEDSPKAFNTLTRIDPETGRTSILGLPYTTEEVAFDTEGHIFLRCAQILGRYRLADMREVPFDYGENRHFRWSSFGRPGTLQSALVLPGNKPVWWHESGMSVNPKGEIAISCCNSASKRKSSMAGADVHIAGRKYKPRVYPGRRLYSEIHVWNKHGKLIAEDVAQGVMDGHGTYIDQTGNIYYLAGGHRIYEGGKDFFPMTGCVVKFKQGKGRLYATRGATVPISKDIDLDGLPQISSGTAGKFYVKGAEWIYPGIGYVHPVAPCQCWNCRFTIDTFGRVFVPETIRNQVALLDTNGNLIMHIGKYGNVDDGVPLFEDRRYRTKPLLSVGGDEVALCYANYVATYTDHRLFIYDAANDRILSVKLDYHAEEVVAFE